MEREGTMKEFHVGFIGLGRRGSWFAGQLLTRLPYVKITAICDLDESKVEENAEVIKEKTGQEVFLKTTDYHEVINCDKVDTVLIFSGWMSHYDAAMEALKLGKPVGSDEKNEKATFPALFGLEQSRVMAKAAVDAAVAALKPFGDKADMLVQLAEYLLSRES